MVYVRKKKYPSCILYYKGTNLPQNEYGVSAGIKLYVTSN